MNERKSRARLRPPNLRFSILVIEELVESWTVTFYFLLVKLISERISSIQYITAWKRVNGRIGDNTEEWPWDKSSLTLANTSGEICTIKGTVSFLKEVTLQNIKNKSQIIDETMRSSWKWMKSKGVQNAKRIYIGDYSAKPSHWAIGSNM
ncbi:hypothetical protein C2G38_2178739 [Gigaspora rosea]|uniref:Uncharacterized protein n=1 Tax=Gigaspora rosea TaxID=44941 RepID=A0A397VNB3_9GLOM|nr:hypothetical protein C2G38_2178739 [Gigaspora rosea]